MRGLEQEVGRGLALHLQQVVILLLHLNHHQHHHWRLAINDINDIIRLPVTVLAFLNPTSRVSLLQTGIFDLDAFADDG